MDPQQKLGEGRKGDKIGCTVICEYTLNRCVACFERHAEMSGEYLLTDDHIRTKAMLINPRFKTTTKRMINSTLRKTFGVELRRVSRTTKRPETIQRKIPHNQHNMPLECSTDEFIDAILRDVGTMLKQAHITVGKTSSIEVSHHYGLARFRDYGAVIIDCINRSYCKKLIVQLPGQRHPYHFHKKKEETFQLLYGDMDVKKEGIWRTLAPGDSVLVRRGERHKFQTKNGAIFEEISTTHYNNDSFYTNEQIVRLPRHVRKTEVIHWRKRLYPEEFQEY